MENRVSRRFNFREGNVGMTVEEVQEAIDLTPEQVKAWNSFERAVKGLKKSNVYLYQVLDTISGLNGNNVEAIDNEENVKTSYGDPGNLQSLIYPGIRVTDGWADDTHIVIIKKRKSND